MTLRLRLTLLHTLLLGGIVMLLGTLVYVLVNTILLNQIDSSLYLATNQLIENLRVNSFNEIDQHSVDDYRPYENQFFQIWDTNHELRIARPANLLEPLDENGQHAGELTLESIESAGTHVRVLSVPVQTARGPVGIVQVGFNLSMLDMTQNTVATVLIGLTLSAMLLSGLIFWYINKQELSRLETVTRVATHITHADDLSRRIPVSGSQEDEIGQLIQAFNQTLERLEDLFSLQERFVADVSHELRTPLTVIKGNIGLMKYMKEFDEESLTSIEDEVNRLTRLVGELLLLAQAEAGQLPLDMKFIYLDQVVSEVHQQMLPLVNDRLTLTLNCYEPVRLYGDRDRLKQMILNLVGNAIQHTPDQGHITVSLTPIYNQAHLTIQDDGSGISEEDIPHIFERFYRGEKSRKRKEGGSFGLGLSIAYWIVHSHGGTIDVSSKVGKGTIFYVCLPMQKH